MVRIWMLAGLLAVGVGLLVVVLVMNPNTSRRTASGDVSNKGRKEICPNESANPPFRSAILFKTHKFDKAIRARLEKVKSESVGLADVVLVVHGDVEVDSDLQCFRIRDQELSRVYDQGFENPWLSNHWLLMAWWRQRGRAAGYQYVWSIEYDVGMVGDSSVLWSAANMPQADLIASYGPFQDPNWPYKDHYTGGKLKNEEKWYGYVQLSRYSAPFLEYMDKTFESGENGQDEMMIFSLAKRGNFSVNTDPITCRHGFWSARGGDAALAREAMVEKQLLPSQSKLTLFHPIK